MEEVKNRHTWRRNNDPKRNNICKLLSKLTKINIKSGKKSKWLIVM